MAFLESFFMLLPPFVVTYISSIANADGETQETPGYFYGCSPASPPSAIADIGAVRA
jgi:hypothetical protein